MSKNTNSPTAVCAVTFDVGGTLIDPSPSVGHVYAKVAAEHGVTGLKAETLNRQFAAAWRSKVNFNYSRESWLAVVSRTIHGLHRPLQEVSFFDSLYDRFAEASAWRVYEDVIPVFDRLLTRGFRLAAISNWDERLRPLLKNLRLDDYFDFVAVSSEIGFPKPSPVIFQEAVRKLGCPPEAIMHIGNSESEDVAGATAAGFQALLLQRQFDHSSARQIRSLTEIESRIG